MEKSPQIILPAPETFCARCPHFHPIIDTEAEGDNYLLQNTITSLMRNGDTSASPIDKDLSEASARSAFEVQGTRTCNAQPEYVKGQSSTQCYQVPKIS